MALSYNSIASGGSSSSGATGNDFTVSTGSSGYTRVDLSKTFSAGDYIVSSSLSDSTLDIYFIAEDGTNAGYVNAAAASFSMTATQGFNKIVIYGGTNNDTLTFEFKYVFPANAASTDQHEGAGPRIISASPNALPNINDTTTITGQNFANDVTITFTGQAGYSSTPAKNIVRTSSTSLIITRPDNLSTAYSPYTITASNPGLPNPTSSSAHILANNITAGASPIWTTSATLPGYRKNDAYSQAVVATDADAGTSITYSVVSSNYPTGITFNTSTGTFEGTPTVDSGTYTATIRATDAGGNFVDRTFTLAQYVPNAPTIGTVTVYARNVTIPFTAPTFTGTSTITSYTATSNTGGYTGTVNQSGSGSITINNIPAGLTLTFSVTATNSSGTSISSLQSNSITTSNYTSFSGGTLTSDATYYYRTFDSSATLSISNNSIPIDYLVVAGGGGGGRAEAGTGYNPRYYQYFDYYYQAGGGGAGGVLQSSTTLNTGSHTITVGSGGASGTTPASGSSSSLGSIASATGGGKGGGVSGVPASGGSGGGGAGGGYMSLTAGSGTSGQGNNGGQGSTVGGGGGGKGAAGTVGSNPNASGGAGSSFFGQTYGVGGNGTANSQVTGSANTGNGGTGAGQVAIGEIKNGSAGGSGRVVIRYLRSLVGG